MVYERIRNLREDKDMTQTQVAAYLNCSQRIYSNYERGEARYTDWDIKSSSQICIIPVLIIF